MNWTDPQLWSLGLTAASLAASGSAITLAAQQRLRSLRERAAEARAVLDGQDRLAASLAELSQALERLPAAAARDPAARLPQVPEILLSPALLDLLVERMRMELDKRPQVEVGFAMVGRIDGEGEGRRIVLNGLIESGCNDRSSGHVRFDREYQQEELLLLQAIDPRAAFLGDAHTHPGDLNEPSEGDYTTDAGNVRSSQTQEMVFVIATDQRHVRAARGNGSRAAFMPSHADAGLLGLRLNFFYLGKASGYRYHRVMPRTLADEPLLCFPLSLRHWHETDPARFAVELEALRRIPGWSMRLIYGAGPLGMEFSSPQRPVTVGITLDRYPAGPPAIYVSVRGGKVVEYADPSLAPQAWSSRTWLVTLLLPLLQRLAAGSIPTPAPKAIDEPMDLAPIRLHLSPDPGNGEPDGEQLQARQPRPCGPDPQDAR